MPNKTEQQLRDEVEALTTDEAASGDGFDVAPSELSVVWREADSEARPDGMEWDAESGTLAFDAWSAQEETREGLAPDADPDLVAFLAGYGSGKSVFGARWLLAQAFEHPGSHFLAMGTTFSEARTSTFEKLFAQLPGEKTTIRTSSFNGPEQSPIISDYNRQENRLTLANDSVITLGSADKWSRFAGSEFGGAWLDEPSHYGSDLFDLLEMMGSRLRGVDGPKKQLWTLTGNGYNAAYEILSRRVDSTGDPIGLNICVKRASTLDNPYLSDGEKERFKRQYAGTDREEQALMGGFEAAQGLVYDEFSRDEHVIPHAEAVGRIEPGWRIFGYDAGWSDPRVLLELGKTAYDQLVVIDEFHESESHVEDAIRWLKANDKPQQTIFAEHEPTDLKRFAKHGWECKKAAKSIEPGISEVQKRLRRDGPDPDEEQGESEGAAGGDSADQITTSGPEPAASDADNDRSEPRAPAGRVGLLVSDNCQNLIQEMLSYKQEDVGTAQATDHCADALRYACMGAAGNSGATVGQSRRLRAIPSTW